MLARGDFLMHFLDIAEEQLVKEVEDIRQSQLQTILDLAVRSSSAVNDEHAEELLASIEGHGLLRRLVDTDDEASLRRRQAQKNSLASTPLCSQCKTPWPASIVLNRRAVTKYQILFRHLFEFKCAERNLCAGWQRLQAMRGNTLGRMFCKGARITQRMLNFLQNYLYYVTNEVIEPYWDKLNSRTDGARSADELIDFHDAFLESCMKAPCSFHQTFSSVSTTPRRRRAIRAGQREICR